MSIQIDTTQVMQELHRLQQQILPAQMQAVYDEIGHAIQNNILLELRVGKSAFGGPFAPLKKPRLRQGSRIAGDIPLNDTRTHIHDKITFKADSTGVEVGMFENVPIGATHQFGSNKNNVPPRPFLPIRNNAIDLPQDWNQQIMGILERHF